MAGATRTNPIAVVGPHKEARPQTKQKTQMARNKMAQNPLYSIRTLAYLKTADKNLPMPWIGKAMEKQTPNLYKTAKK